MSLLLIPPVRRIMPIAQGLFQNAGAGKRPSLPLLLSLRRMERSARGPYLPEQPTVGIELRRVIPIASDDLGRGTRVVSVEIYNQGLIVRWLIAPPPDDLDDQVTHFPHAPLFALSDDAGTHYNYLSSGGFGSSDATRGDELHRPAPPEEATALDLTHRGERIRVRLA